MSVQGSFLKFFNLWGNCRNTYLHKYWYNFQQVACVSRTIEEKYNLPPKPKKPLTPYLRYMTMIRPELRKNSPSASTVDIVKECALRWEKIDSEMKKKLEAEYAKEHLVYNKLKLNYDTNLTEEQKELLKKVKIERRGLKEKRKIKKKMRECNKPKRPCSGFIHFLRTELPSRNAENFGPWIAKISLKWKNMNDEQKKPFIDKTQKELEEYRKSIAKWELEMIKSGNVDIVRKDAMLELKPKTKPRNAE